MTLIHSLFLTTSETWRLGEVEETRLSKCLREKFLEEYIISSTSMSSPDIEGKDFSKEFF